MIKVIKKKGNIIKAYCLSDTSPIIEKLIAEKRIVPLSDGKYEIFSQEAVNGGSGHGQVAAADDYIKIDSEGFPYPNKASYFIENHKHISGDEYEQIPKPLNAWTVQEPMCKEVSFLIREKGLVLDEANPDRYYSAVLWGTKEAAAKDAVLVFYNISYNDDGSVRDAEFNFVKREEFDKTYSFC